MICQHCQSESVQRFGKDRNGNQRFRCKTCKKTWIAERVKPLGDMRLPIEKAIQCLRLLLDGISIRACERFMGISRNTLCDLILNLGQRCQAFLANRLDNVPVADVQVDEIWSFVGKKERTKRQQNDFDPAKGDAYAYIGIERNSKLIVAFLLGKRNECDTYEFAAKLRRSTCGRFQLSTDGWGHYCHAMPMELGNRIDFSQLMKSYVNAPRTEGKYSPGQIVKLEIRPICGNPIESKVCTSHVERSNLTVRMTIRRWTRLTNAFSKSWKHHEAAVALYIAFYNFIRPHMTLNNDTPAMAAKITDHKWTWEELLNATAV